MLLVLVLDYTVRQYKYPCIYTTEVHICTCIQIWYTGMTVDQDSSQMGKWAFIRKLFPDQFFFHGLNTPNRSKCISWSNKPEPPEVDPWSGLAWTHLP